MDNFQAYGEFARVYDMFQDNVDYQTWGQWLKQQLAAQGITRRTCAGSWLRHGNHD